MKLTQAVFTSIAIWVPAIYLLSSSPRTTATAVTPSQTEWREVGVYRNAAGKTVQLKERLITSEWDHLTNGKRVTFQINAIGRDFGAMEFDVICNATDPYVFERKIRSLTQDSEHSQTVQCLTSRSPRSSLLTAIACHME